MTGVSVTRGRTRASERVAPFGETVFATYSRLARESGAVDLGQGYPDFDPPDIVKQALREAADGYQQYPPLPGWPPLLEVLARQIGVRLGRSLEPTRNLLATVGATEGLFAAMQALVDPGDEVVLIEPFYDAYPADVIMAGGVPRFVPLEPQADGTWQLDPRRLQEAFSSKTRIIVVNSPHNPTGKVFNAEELDLVIELAHRHDAVILFDGVYEHISFVPFVHVAARPGGWERTLALSSFGKTFSATGWKLGWVCGPEELIAAVRRAHQWIPFTVATPLQVAAAAVLEDAAEGTYYQGLTSEFRSRRDTLLEALSNTPLKAKSADGGYFVMADSSELGYGDDVELCLDLPRRTGVGAIPPSAFYSAEHRHLARHLVRFAFCKRQETLREAGARLMRLSVHD